jgi:ABC-type lipoprotein export system ATPase subunit
MIHLKQVTKVYPSDGANSVTALRELTLVVQRGDFVVIKGRSGSGKTTALNLMAGLTRPTSGVVEVEGVDLWSLPDRQQSAMRNYRMGFVFQFPSLLPSLTVLENVILPTIFGPGLGPDETAVRARTLLATVGLEDKLTAFPRQLSAGQQQRVVIARSLINQPEILMADEPTSNLDEQTEREIISILEKVHQLQGVTVVMVTHTPYLSTPGALILELAEGRVAKQSRI